MIKFLYRLVRTTVITLILAYVALWILFLLPACTTNDARERRAREQSARQHEQHFGGTTNALKGMKIPEAKRK